MTARFDPGDVERFRGIVAAQFGLQFEDSKLGFLADVLRKRLEAGNQDSHLYLTHLEGTPRIDEEASALARELTVGETYFFRNNDQFRAFAETVVPAVKQARRLERRMRVLSAGCASGEEAYTLAIILREVIPDTSWNVSIRAVDINPAALERAAEARFSGWALRETPLHVQNRWFRAAGRDFTLADEVRNAVTFEQRNLAADDPDLWRPNFYDVIFCRNVIMYFSPEKMRSVVARIAGALTPGGYLFLGHAETLRGLSQDFHLLHTHDTFYYRRRCEGEEPEPSPVFLDRRSPLDAPTSSVSNGSTAWIDTIAQAAERIRALGNGQPAVTSKTLSATPPKWDIARVLDLLQLERFAEALDVVRAMPAEAARDPDVLLLTAVLMAHSGQLIAGAEVASRLLAQDELNSGGHYVLALCYEGAGDRAAANHHYQFAVHLDPEFAMPRLHLGILAKRSGDRTVARRELSQALLLLQREDASRLLLFGGGFTREGLVSLCKAELSAIEGRS